MSELAQSLDEFFNMGGRSFVVRVIATFSDNVDCQYAAGGHALMQSNWPVVAQIGHTLRSSSASVGAPGLARKFHQLERAALAEDGSAAADLLRSIQTLSLQWRQACTDYLGRADRS